MKTIGSLTLVVGQRYRGRLLIKAPKLVAGESRVRTELEGEGFRNIVFYSQGSLPADWPADQRSDPSGFGSWTAYLEGVYTGQESSGSSMEANENVQLLGFWPYGASVAPPQPNQPLPQPSGPTDGPVPLPQPEWQETAGSVAALGISMVVAYVLQSRWLRSRS